MPIEFHRQQLVSELHNVELQVFPREGEPESAIHGHIILEDFRYLTSSYPDIANELRILFCIPDAIEKNRIIWCPSNESWIPIEQDQQIPLELVVALTENLTRFMHGQPMKKFRHGEKVTKKLNNLQQHFSLYPGIEAFCMAYTADGNCSLKIMHFCMGTPESGSIDTLKAFGYLLAQTKAQQKSIRNRIKKLGDTISKTGDKLGDRDQKKATQFTQGMLNEIAKLMATKKQISRKLIATPIVLGILVVLAIGSYQYYAKYYQWAKDKVIPPIRQGGDIHLFELGDQEKYIDQLSPQMNSAIHSGLHEAYLKMAKIYLAKQQKSQEQKDTESNPKEKTAGKKYDPKMIAKILQILDTPTIENDKVDKQLWLLLWQKHLLDVQLRYDPFFAEQHHFGKIEPKSLEKVQQNTIKGKISGKWEFAYKIYTTGKKTYLARITNECLQEGIDWYKFPKSSKVETFYNQITQNR